MDLTVSGRSIPRDICACEAMGFRFALRRRSLPRRRFSTAYLSLVKPPNPCILARTGCTDGLPRTRAMHSSPCCVRIRNGRHGTACSKGLAKLEHGDAILFGAPTKWPHNHRQQLTLRRSSETPCLLSSPFPRKVRVFDGLCHSMEVYRRSTSGLHK